MSEFDVTKLDPASQRAFQYAVDFYEKDHTLTPSQRGLLAETYSGISSFTMAVGWSTFFTITAIPFYRQKLRTGSTKGTNVGIAILFGMGGMMFSSPYAASKAYNWKLEQLREQDTKCYEVAQLLKPGESSKWWLYYKLTKDHPEHIMKDPRSKEAEEQRKKTIYSGRDPFGLYTGPRHEMNKRRVDTIPDVDDNSIKPTTTPNSDSIDDDDPFTEKEDEEPVYASAWDRIRASDSPQKNSWGKVRTQPEVQNPYTTNVYRVDTKEKSEQDEFDRLLEEERNIGEREDKKW